MSNPNLHMKSSNDMVCMLMHSEACVLKTYIDSGGEPTIGIGHTKFAGDPEPTKGLAISIKESIALLKKDLKKYEAIVKKEINVLLEQYEFDALVHHVYNTGGYYKDKAGKWRPASLFRLVNEDKPEAAMDSLRLWNKDNGKVVNGLKIRREIEAKLFLTGQYPNTKTVKVYHDGYPGKFKRIKVEDLPLLDTPTKPQITVERKLTNSTITDRNVTDDGGTKTGSFGVKAGIAGTIIAALGFIALKLFGG